MVHAENGDLVALGQQRVFDAGITGPEGHALSRPPELEAEATNRAIMMAQFINVPLYVVHVMSKMAMEEVATARKRGVRVVGEPLCTGLAKDQSELWNPDFDHAAAHVMSPPVRTRALSSPLRTRVAHVLNPQRFALHELASRHRKRDRKSTPSTLHPDSSGSILCVRAACVTLVLSLSIDIISLTASSLFTDTARLC
jgi:dihydropyrimidinase